MSLITFSAFRTEINRLVFPEGQAEVRVPLFRNFIVNALIQLQTFVESYQSVNVNFYDKDQSWDDCGLSIVQACRGRIGAVYAFKPSCRCQRFFYDSASLEKLSCFYEHCRCHQSGTCCCGQSMFSAPSLYTPNPYYCGDYVDGNTGCRPPYLQAEPEDDCAFRLSEKFFAVGPNQKLWLFPRFPCGYVLGVHWRGIRRSYLDHDYVPDDDDLKDAVAAYVESEIARRVDKNQATADKLYAEYRMKAGDIIFREEQDLKPRATRVCVEGLDLSELVQIYPDNPYPTYVGQQCQTGRIVTQPEVPIVPDAPLEYWTLDEASGNRVGCKNGIILAPQSGGWGSGAGKVGNAARFVSGPGYLDTGMQPTFNHGGRSLSVTLWFKIENNPSPLTASTLFNWWFHDAGSNQVSYFQLDWSGFLGFNLTAVNSTTATQAQLVVAPVVTIDQWYFIHAYYDVTTGKVSLEIDNVAAGTSSGSVVLDAASVNGRVLLFTTATLPRIFNVDELAIRAYLPSAAELDSNYNGGSGNTCPS